MATLDFADDYIADLKDVNVENASHKELVRQATIAAQWPQLNYGKFLPNDNNLVAKSRGYFEFLLQRTRKTYCTVGVFRLFIRPEKTSNITVVLEKACNFVLFNKNPEK